MNGFVVFKYIKHGTANLEIVKISYSDNQEKESALKVVREMVPEMSWSSIEVELLN